MIDIDRLTVGEFLNQVFSSWWELQNEMGRVKLATIYRNGSKIELNCVLGEFSPKERAGFSELIPLGSKKASFTQLIEENDSIEINGKSYTPLVVSDLPWGPITEYIIAIVPADKGGGGQ